MTQPIQETLNELVERCGDFLRSEIEKRDRVIAERGTRELAVDTRCRRCGVVCPFCYRGVDVRIPMEDDDD